MCVNNLFKVALDGAAAGIEPLQSQVQRPNHYATEHVISSQTFSPPGKYVNG